MELKDMNKEDLELLSYTDLTNMILKENGKPMNTPAIFRIICDLLEYSDAQYSGKIGDYYTSLTTDKRFILLDSAEWDLKDKHSVPLIIEDDEEDFEETLEEDDIEEDEEEDIDAVIEDDDIEDDEEDIDDLSIVADDELEDEEN